MSEDHTPGPWKTRIAANGASVAVVDSNSGAVIALAKSDHPDTKGRKEANARVIAAAPDLLAQLKIATAHLEHQAAWIAARNAGYSFEALGEDMGGITAAIAKAGQP